MTQPNQQNNSPLKLGRRAHDTDPRNLLFSKYAAALPTPPPAVDYTKGKTDFGVMLNDQLGDCTIAACGHAVQIWTANAAKEITFPDSAIENAYSWWDGYVPGDPSTDLGGIPTVVLNHWVKHSFNGNKLLAYVAVDIANLTEVKQSIYLLGGNYVGLTVPNYVMSDLTDPGSTWDVDPSGDNGIAGGHAVWACGYRADGSIIIISWGNIYYVTPAFWAANMDESFALLNPAWFTSKNLSVSGFKWGQLWADLAAL